MCTYLKYHLHTCICEFKIFEIFRIFKICCAHTSTIIFTPAFLDLKYLKCLKYLKYFLHTTHLKYHLHTCIANMKVRPSTINIGIMCGTKWEKIDVRLTDTLFCLRLPDFHTCVAFTLPILPPSLIKVSTDWIFASSQTEQC